MALYDPVGRRPSCNMEPRHDKYYVLYDSSSKSSVLIALFYAMLNISFSQGTIADNKIFFAGSVAVTVAGAPKP